MPKNPPLLLGADKGYPHPGADKGADNQLAPNQNLKAVPSFL